MVKRALVALGVLWLVPVGYMIGTFMVLSYRGYYEPKALVFAAVISAVVVACAYLADRLGKHTVV